MVLPSLLTVFTLSDDRNGRIRKVGEGLRRPQLAVVHWMQGSAAQNSLGGLKHSLSLLLESWALMDHPACLYAL